MQNHMGAAAQMIDRAEIERIILVEVLGFKKPERAGTHCGNLAANAAIKILAALEDTTAQPQSVSVHEETLADFIADTHDKYGPGCDELTVSQALLRTYSITRPHRGSGQ